MKVVLALVLLFPALFATGAFTGAETIPAVVHPIGSIDPAHPDDADLRALDAAIGDARLVMLGEPAHGAGSALLAKTRVVKYLHERMGFDVLAFESGLYDLHAAQSLIRAGEPPTDVLGRAVFPVWTESEQFQPLLAYLDDQQAGDAPLTVAGFDAQFTGERSADLPAELDRLNARLPGDGAGLARLTALIAAVIAVDQGALRDPTVDEIETDLAATLARLQAANLPDRDWWRQVLESSAANLLFLKGWAELTPGILNTRDAQMADNLAWLAESAFPDRKIIVWGATAHLTKERELEPDAAPNMLPMGETVHRQFGDEVFVLAFTAYTGEYASYATRDVTSVGTAPPGSIEAVLHASGHEQAFLDADDLNDIAPEPQTSWMLGFEPMRGDWARMVDGIFFIDTMQPSTWPPLAS